MSGDRQIVSTGEQSGRRWGLARFTIFMATAFLSSPVVAQQPFSVDVVFAGSGRATKSVAVLQDKILLRETMCGPNSEGLEIPAEGRPGTRMFTSKSGDSYSGAALYAKFGDLHVVRTAYFIQYSDGQTANEVTEFSFRVIGRECVINKFTFSRDERVRDLTRDMRCELKPLSAFNERKRPERDATCQ